MIASIFATASLITSAGVSLSEAATATPLPVRVQRIGWVADEVDKGRYATFMRKEIDEQPTAFGATIAPAGLKTEAGIGVGSTVAELSGTYPSVVINPGSDLGGPNFLINDGLAGFLTGVTPTDTVTSVLGGQGCGE